MLFSTMRLRHPYCIIGQAFSAEFCRRVIDLGEAAKTVDATVTRDPSNTVRNSTVAWLRRTDESAWLYEAVDRAVHETNQRLWNWRLSMAESMQYTHYGAGQHYGWHADQRRKPYPDDDTRWPGLLRKLSVAVCLADSDDYEGGDFIIETLETPPDRPGKRLKTLREMRRMGAMLIFPSHLYHRVAPVTAGRRRSLVAWYVGPPFV